MTVQQVVTGGEEVRRGTESSQTQAGQEVAGGRHVHLEDKQSAKDTSGKTLYLEVKNAQNNELHVKQFLGRKRTLREVEQLLDVRWVILLHLASQVERSDSNELQLVRLHVSLVQDRVKKRDRNVEGLLGELQVVLHLAKMGL